MLDKSKTYGLSLEGGGFRGSYQAGAITALFESGIKIGAVCGTSIGSLNAAFVAMKDLERLKKLWFNFDITDIFETQNKDLENALRLDFKNTNFFSLGKELIQTTLKGGLNVRPLVELIDREIDEEAIRKSDINMGLVTYNLSDKKAEELMIKDIPQGELKKYLLASAYFPAFKREPLDEKLYIDGGVYNNLPSNMLADAGYDDIIQIKLHRMHLRKKPKRKVNLYDIRYKEYLGPIIIYKKDKILKNFENGYNDTIDFIES